MEKGNATDNSVATSRLEQDSNAPEFIRELTEKVYALWLRDLQLERERLGIRSNRRTGIQTYQQRGRS